MRFTQKFLKALKADPLSMLKELTDAEIAELIQKARYEYFNTETPLMPDNIFDLVKETLAARDPHHPILDAVGAAVQQKVKLPYFMGSLDKIKTGVAKFAQTYPGSYVISDKLDGNSAMLADGKLYSRGDGTEGQDISHLLSFIQNVPKNLSKNLAVRGELIISRQDFEKVKHRGANARNMVAGLINAKIPDLDLLKRVQFVAYELIHPRQMPSEQFHTLENTGFKTPYHVKVDKLTDDALSEILIDRRKNSPFEVDGIVVSHDALHNRVNGENPKHAFAFKSIHTMEEAEVIVSKVHWNVSKDAYFIPVVEFPPVKLAGVSIQRATGFNGKFIWDNKIGPGSTLIIIRSGDVIPTIKQVLTPSEPQMPDAPYAWTQTGVDIVASQANNHEVDQKNLENFFVKLGVRGVSKGTVAKIYAAGYTTPRAALVITKQELLTIASFKDKSAQNYLDAVEEAIKKVDCVKLMDASNALGRGFGPKKLELILSKLPNILNTREMPSVNDLIAIKGIEKKTAEAFVTRLPRFFAFYDGLGITCQTETADLPEIKKIAGVFVFSGFRDKELEKQITDHGGEVASGISKRVTYLVLKDKNSQSSKSQKARELGIQILSPADIRNLF